MKMVMGKGNSHMTTKFTLSATSPKLSQIPIQFRSKITKE